MCRSAAAEEVNGHSWEGDPDTDQRVDRVAVERHHHQEDGEETENDGVYETELWEKERGEVMKIWHVGMVLLKLLKNNLDGKRQTELKINLSTMFLVC